MIKNKHLMAGFVAVVLMLSACKKESEKATVKIDSLAASQEGSTKDSVKTVAEQSDYQSETTDNATAEKLKLYLQDYLKTDLPSLEAQDRKFSFYAVDLNNDKKDEYLISLSGRAFCGSGGCTFLLLSNDLKLINRFTVMNPPVFRSAGITSGWNDLILISGNEKYKHLKWDAKTGKYPSNPSLVKDTEIAPSGHDFIMWDDNFSRAKIFEF
ncbi:hypothetical protein BOQ62_02285 [Chryseobacterium sp. CH21]|uniref:hypothetical protein n=1 Tax=Chryseobacterium sp. CH21 TaxID=713556 RepID=UPI00100B3493|nr:hypothetical protein [Chryseobacterium sp. CH21]RXM41108.1 hypothetical protein BOQ62_02285 [Chryseobacterium sp. CH21]